MGDNPLARALMPVARAAAILCGWCLLLVAALTCVEIVARKLFDFSLHGIDEIGGYTLALVCAFGFSYALLRGSHTRIDIVQPLLPARVRATLNVVAMAALAAIALFAAWRGLGELLVSIELKSVANSPLQTPMWLPQGLWFAGIAMFAIVALALAGHAVFLFLTNRREANRYYGHSISAEVLDEVPTRIRAEHARRAEP